MEWNGTGGFRKRWSRESIRVWKDVGILREMLEMLECGIAKHQSMENIRKHQKTLENTSGKLENTYLCLFMLNCIDFQVVNKKHKQNKQDLLLILDLNFIQ